MGSICPDGQPLLFDQLSGWRPGDLVCVYAVGALERLGPRAGLVKRLLGKLRDGRIAVEQDYPHRQVAFDPSRIVTIVRCLGPVEEVAPGKYAIDWARVREARAGGGWRPPLAPTSPHPRVI